MARPSGVFVNCESALFIYKFLQIFHGSEKQYVIFFTTYCIWRNYALDLFTFPASTQYKNT
jgi:hypothetical protein